MKVFFDTEFHEMDEKIYLISIGIVREDGRTYYAVNSDYDFGKANDWLKENVIKNLGEGKQFIPRNEIKIGIINFLSDCKPEFWAWYGGYDWVILSQLFGGLFGFPNDWPMYFKEVQQLFGRDSTPKINLDNYIEHNSLSDAIYAMKLWEFAQKELVNV